MAQECGFFNAELEGSEYDRVYNAEQFAAYFASFIGNGVFGNSMGELVVLENQQANMSVDVSSGKAWINGWWYRNTEELNLPITLADGVLNRKDIVVLRWGIAERDMWLQVLQGEPSGEPIAPEIVRNADYYDLKLCEISIPAGTSRITQSLITDTRLDNNVCGLVTGLVDQIDTTELYLQFNAQFGDFMDTNYEEFNTWFQHMKDQLDEDAAGHLQNEIDEIDIELTKLQRDTESVFHYFPNLEGAGYSSNCSLMVAGNKTVLFDAGATVNETAILDYFQSLYDEGKFSNIDYIIISHYHWDHIQCLADILDAFPHEDCHAYLPMDITGYITDASIFSNRTSVISTLNTNNIPYTEVDEDTVVEVVQNNCSIELFNSNETAYNHYYDISSVYNNYSMVSLVKVGNIYAMYPGDIQRDAQDYIVANRQLPRLFLYSIHHHGIQNDDNIQFLEMISPEYGILQTNHTRQLVSAKNSMTANYICKNICSSAYSSHAFVMNKDSGFIIDGVSIDKSGWDYSVIDFYVDNEYLGIIHDGSQEHPFTDINEFTMFINDSRNLSYRLHIKANSTPYEILYLRDINSPITLLADATDNYSEPLIKGAWIANSKYIGINNCVFIDATEINGNTCVLFVEQSNVNLINCTIDGCYSTTPIQRLGEAICSRVSDIYLANCTIKNVNQFYVTLRFSTFVANTLIFNNVGTCYQNRQSNVIIRGLDSITNCDYYIGGTGSMAAMPITISNISSTDLAAFKALMAYNRNTALSNPFRLSDQLTLSIKGKCLVGSAVSDLNDATEEGDYRYSGTSSNKPPISSSGGALRVHKFNDTYYEQLAFTNEAGIYKIAYRKHNTNGWSSWYVFEPTLVQ